jgi:hypothetical protein
MSTDSKTRPNRPSVSKAEWSQTQVEEFNADFAETSELDSIVPKQFTTEAVTGSFFKVYFNV